MARRALLACSLIAGACALLRAAVPTSTTVTLAVPGRVNAHVSLAARERFVAAVWSGATKTGPSDIYAAVSGDGGRTFGAPVRVNTTAGFARVNGEQPPRVTLVPIAGAAPQIAVVWTAKTPTGTALLTARSTDGGRTFGPSSPIPGTDAAGNRGWEAIGADPGGAVHAVWLDHRRLAAGESTSHHGAAERCASGRHRTITTPDRQQWPPARSPTVWPWRSSRISILTRSGIPRPPRAITSGVCYCCKTAIAFGAKGAMYLAWRHVYPGNFRDIAFTASADGGRTFARAGSREPGQLDAGRLSRRWARHAGGWPWARPHRVAGCGDRARSAGQGAVSRDVDGWTVVFAARPDSDRGAGESPAANDRRRRFADAGLG